MRRVKSSFGGFFPNDAKKRTAQTPIEILKAPETLVVSLSQHAGKQAKPVVAKGDEVLKGQLIAEADGAISAPIHSPVSGTIKAIEPRIHPSGDSIPAIVIENDGEEKWIELEQHLEPVQLDASTIREKIRDAGVVGMGGGGFPTALKLEPPEGITIDFLIINGCECEPYLTADDRIMIEYAKEIILGARLMAKASGARQIVFAIEDNKPEAINAIKAEAGALDVVVLQSKYPMGGERQLIQAITGREVPSGGLPYDAGVIVNNVGTAYAVAKAVRDGQPFISRVITVSGDPLVESKNFFAPIGTPFQYLIESAGGFKETPGKIVAGGPMMGSAQFDLDSSMGKTCTGLLALAKGESATPNVLPCIKCARCVDVCPANLLPLKLEAFGMNEMWNEAYDYGALDCIECGSCNYVCPSKRPLLQYIRFAKREIIAEQAKSS